MNTQLGVDLTYHTLYYPYSYMPATGRFYRQDQIQAGNYPFMNVFLNFKVKRTTAFFMFDHVNADLMTENVRYNYYYDTQLSYEYQDVPVWSSLDIL